MKKLFLSAVVLLFFIACNNNATDNSRGVDTGVGLGPDMGTAPGATGTGVLSSDSSNHSPGIESDTAFAAPPARK